MRWDNFGGSVLFAALAAALWIPVALVAAPLFGGFEALALYLSIVAALYAAGMAPRGVRRARVAVALGAAAFAASHLCNNAGELALALAALLGLTRGVCLYPRTAARTLVTEALLIGGGLLFARLLAAPSLLSSALALWGFLLVQSLFFLTGGARARDAARSDPFDDAYRRATAMLGDR